MNKDMTLILRTLAAVFTCYAAVSGENLWPFICFLLWIIVIIQDGKKL